MNERLLFWGIYSHRLSRIRVPRGKLGVSFELWIKMARRVVPPGYFICCESIFREDKGGA